MTQRSLQFFSPFFLALAGCSASSGPMDPGGETSPFILPQSGSGSGSNTGAGANDAGELTVLDDETMPEEMGPPPEVMILPNLPEGFTAADGAGGWKVIGPIEEVPISNDEGCGNVLRGMMRDLPAAHSDFEGAGAPAQLNEGIVNATLGADRKPSYLGVIQPYDGVMSAGTFSHWYNNVQGENRPFVVDVWLQPVGDKFVFDSSSFFPLAGVGYAAESCTGDCAGQAEGYSFTTELHTQFKYNGGEIFTFRGDDDVWVFVNNQLALDLGGIHLPLEGSLQLDALAAQLGLSVGGVYSLDLFHAERSQSESNFRVETTLDFSNCGEILEGDIVIVK